jgi:GR25 family glycosyltransferase involved in LPS biosynthesis
MKFEVLCLSLKTDTHRREHMETVFKKMGTPVKFFDATTPEEITSEVEEKYFKNCDFYEWDINHKAVMATFVSHMRLLEYSVLNQTNILVIEDDLDYVYDIDFNKVNFNDFDMFNVGLEFSCYSYFVTSNGSKKILDQLTSKAITQAYDWELKKLNDVRIIHSGISYFVQLDDKFKSNIAPNGYNKY